MRFVGRPDECPSAGAGDTSPDSHDGISPPGAAPASVPAGCPLPQAPAKHSALCCAPDCVFHLQSGEWFSEISLFKQEPEGATFHVDGIQLAFFGSIG